MFRDVWRSLTRLVDPMDAYLRGKVQDTAEKAQTMSEVLEVQTFRYSTLVSPQPPGRIYEYTLPHFGLQEVGEAIRMDLFGNYKTQDFLLKALHRAVEADPDVAKSQHIVLRAAGGWTGHIHIPNNANPTFFHVWVATDSLPAAAADGAHQKSVMDLQFHRVVMGTVTSTEMN